MFFNATEIENLFNKKLNIQQDDSQIPVQES